MTNKIEINGEIYIKESDITPEFKNELAKDSLNPFKVGDPYFIRTVTFSYVGILEAVYDDELVLSKCTWVVNTGRFSDAMHEGFGKLESSELKPFKQDQKVIIGRGGIIDASFWYHDLPTEQK